MCRMVLVIIARLRCSVLSRCVCCVGLIGRSHISVAGHRPPTSASLPLLNTRHSSSSKATRQPAAQNFLVEIRDTGARPGTMCASVMLYRSHEMSRLLLGEIGNRPIYSNKIGNRSGDKPYYQINNGANLSRDANSAEDTAPPWYPSSKQRSYLAIAR